MKLPLTDPYWCGSMFCEMHSIIHLQVNDSMTLVSTSVSEMGLLQLRGWVDFWDGADVG